MAAEYALQAKTSTFGSCPDSARLSLTLGKSSNLLNNAQYGEAAAVLRPLYRLDCDARVGLLLAAALEENGEGADAHAVLQHAHLIWPNNNSVSCSLARGYLKEGKVDQAARALDRFNPDASTPSQELEVGIVVWLSSQQLERALTTAQINYSAYPSLHTLLLLANSLQLEGRYKEVVTLLQGNRTVYGRSAAFLITLAESESDEKIYDAARADLRSAITIDPKLYQEHYLLGNVLMNLGDVDEGIAEYHLAINLAPEQPRTFFALSLALRAKQDEAGEKDALERTLARNTHYAMAHSEMGRILMNQGLFSDAIVQLKLAIVDNPSSEQAYYLLSRAYDRVGKTDESIEIAKRLESVRSANHRQAQKPQKSRTKSDPILTP